MLHIDDHFARLDRNGHDDSDPEMMRKSGPFRLGCMRERGWTRNLREANKGTSPDDEVSSRGAEVITIGPVLSAAMCMPSPQLNL